MCIRDRSSKICDYFFHGFFFGTLNLSSKASSPWNVGDFLPELERKPEMESADVEIAALSTSFHLNLKVFIICAWLQGGGGDQIRIWIISDFNRVGLRSPRRFYSTPGAAFQWSAVLYHFQNLTLSIFYISRCDKRPCLPLPLDLAYKEPAGCSCDWTKVTSSCRTWWLLIDREARQFFELDPYILQVSWHQLRPDQWQCNLVGEAETDSWDLSQWSFLKGSLTWFLWVE